MDYNLASLRERVLVDKIDDDEYPATVINNFINDTQRDIFNQYELPFMEKIFNGSVSNGATIFGMPDDLALIQSFVVTSPEEETRDISNGYIGFRDFNKQFPVPANNDPSEIVCWTLYGGNMLLSAPTDDDYILTTFYIKKPEVLTQDDDVPEVPEEFAEALVLGALMRLHQRNEEYDIAAETRKDYIAMVLQLVSRYGFRKDGPIKMKNRQTG